MAIAQDRLLVLERIRDYEAKGLFEKDVEDDPPSRPLRSGEVDYIGRRWTTRLAARIATKKARRYFEGCRRAGAFVYAGCTGMENAGILQQGGVVITCNHFNAFDNYAAFLALEPALVGRPLYKVIREGNYTSFPGVYGYFFRHCNTLPLGSDVAVMKEFLRGAYTLLARGEKLLMYPEQGMWWNYRKPRPVKAGAYQIAARAGVPVLPLFITTADTGDVGEDGYPVQAYTVHILPPILPEPAQNARQNAQRMGEENYRLWKETYERVYGIPLCYTTQGEVRPCST